MTERTLTGPERIARQPARKGRADPVLGTRNLMMVPARSVAGLIALTPLSYVTPATGASQDTVRPGCALMGLRTIPLPAAVVRRPGAALLAAATLGMTAAPARTTSQSAAPAQTTGTQPAEANHT